MKMKNNPGGYEPLHSTIAYMPRRCLGIGCGKVFASASKGHRFCPNCTKRNESLRGPDAVRLPSLLRA